MNDALAQAISDIALAAGDAILEIRDRGTAVREKSDQSPVTDSDEAANALIVARLAALTPDIPIVAEESVAAGDIPEIGARFWLVDPLDGTREFIADRDEFTVNIALIENQRPTLGVVGVPAKDELYIGLVGAGAWFAKGSGPREAIAARPVPDKDPIALASRSHGSAETEAWLAKHEITRTVRAGSSVKFCRVAKGEADLYPRFGRTMEWDTAAGHGVLVAAGGSMHTVDGGDFLYGKAEFENPHFIARGA